MTTLFVFVVVLIVLTVIAAIARTVTILSAMSGVPAKHRADVLRGLAECFRWWPR